MQPGRPDQGIDPLLTRHPLAFEPDHTKDRRPPAEHFLPAPADETSAHVTGTTQAPRPTKSILGAPNPQPNQRQPITSTSNQRQPITSTTQPAATNHIHNPTSGNQSHPQPNQRQPITLLQSDKPNKATNNSSNLRKRMKTPTIVLISQSNTTDKSWLGSRSVITLLLASEHFRWETTWN